MDVVPASEVGGEIETLVTSNEMNDVFSFVLTSEDGKKTYYITDNPQFFTKLLGFLEQAENFMNWFGKSDETA